MKKLWTGTDPVALAILRSALEEKDIRYTVKNENLMWLAGGLPAQDVWPEVWILDEDRWEDATALLRDLTRTRAGNHKPRR